MSNPRSTERNLPKNTPTPTVEESATINQRIQDLKRLKHAEAEQFAKDIKSRYNTLNALIEEIEFHINKTRLLESRPGFGGSPTCMLMLIVVLNAERRVGAYYEETQRFEMKFMLQEIQLSQRLCELQEFLGE